MTEQETACWDAQFSDEELQELADRGSLMLLLLSLGLD
jgi:hypothetical protein